LASLRVCRNNTRARTARLSKPLLFHLPLLAVVPPPNSFRHTLCHSPAACLASPSPRFCLSSPLHSFHSLRPPFHTRLAPLSSFRTPPHSSLTSLPPRRQVGGRHLRRQLFVFPSLFLFTPALLLPFLAPVSDAFCKLFLPFYCWESRETDGEKGERTKRGL
jgi:hypothetical protein